jgi:hypothetical protein
VETAVATTKAALRMAAGRSVQNQDCVRALKTVRKSERLILRYMTMQTSAYCREGRPALREGGRGGGGGARVVLGRARGLWG